MAHLRSNDQPMLDCWENTAKLLLFPLNRYIYGNFLQGIECYWRLPAKEHCFSPEQGRSRNEITIYLCSSYYQRIGSLTTGWCNSPNPYSFVRKTTTKELKASRILIYNFSYKACTVPSTPRSAWALVCLDSAVSLPIIHLSKRRTLRGSGDAGSSIELWHETVETPVFKSLWLPCSMWFRPRFAQLPSSKHNLKRSKEELQTDQNDWDIEMLIG